jgi:hypothetical protein
LKIIVFVILQNVKDLELIEEVRFFASYKDVAPAPSPAGKPPGAAVLH